MCGSTVLFCIGGFRLCTHEHRCAQTDRRAQKHTRTPTKSLSLSLSRSSSLFKRNACHHKGDRASTCTYIHMPTRTLSIIHKTASSLLPVCSINKPNKCSCMTFFFSFQSSSSPPNIRTAATECSTFFTVLLNSEHTRIDKLSQLLSLRMSTCFLCVRACVRVCVCLCVRACVCVLNTHPYTHKKGLLTSINITKNKIKLIARREF